MPDNVTKRNMLPICDIQECHIRLSPLGFCPIVTRIDRTWTQVTACCNELKLYLADFSNELTEITCERHERKDLCFRTKWDGPVQPSHRAQFQATASATKAGCWAITLT